MNSSSAADETEPVLFSVIIPAYQAERTLDACLAALIAELNRAPEIKAEIIVVDDGSRDQTASIACKFPCRLIRLEENRGAAAARNVGIRSARGRFIWFLDADGVATPGILRTIHKALTEDGVDGVFGVFSKAHAHRNFPSQYKMHLLRSYFLRIRTQTRGFCTAVCALRKDALDSVGGFDEKFTGASVEDVEIGERLATEGYRISFVPEIEVEHHKYYSWRSLAATQFRRAYAMGKLFFEKSGLRETARTGFFFLIPVSFGMSLVIAPLIVVFAGATYFWGVKSLMVAGLLYVIMMASHASFLRSLLQHNGPFYLGGAMVVLPLDFSMGAFAAGLGWLSAFAASVRTRKLRTNP